MSGRCASSHGGKRQNENIQAFVAWSIVWLWRSITRYRLPKLVPPAATGNDDLAAKAPFFCRTEVVGHMRQRHQDVYKPWWVVHAYSSVV